MKATRSMNKVKYTITIIAVFFFTNCYSQNYIANKNIYGKWVGKGKFNNTKIRADVGDVDFIINVNEDNIVSGTIGDAKIIDSKIMRHVTTSGKDGNTLKCKLEGKINNNSKLKRKYMKIIMYVGDKNEVSTNFFYGRRIGGVILKKE